MQEHRDHRLNGGRIYYVLGNESTEANVAHCVCSEEHHLDETVYNKQMQHAMLNVPSSGSPHWELGRLPN